MTAATLFDRLTAHLGQSGFSLSGATLPGDWELSWTSAASIRRDLRLGQDMVVRFMDVDQQPVGWVLLIPQDGTDPLEVIADYSISHDGFAEAMDNFIP